MCLGERADFTKAAFRHCHNLLLPQPAALQAPVAALHAGRLVCLVPAAPGGSRLDAARSIDLLAARESVSFLARMRPEVASAAKELEAWVALQQHGVGLATAGGEMSTDKLLKVRGGASLSLLDASSVSRLSTPGADLLTC